MAIDEKKLIEELKALKKEEPKDWYPYGEEIQGYNEAIDDVLELIESKPKISLENKTSDNMNSSCSGQVWILVEEALPEPYVDMIVTYMYNEKKYVRTAFYCNGKNWWCTDIQKDFDVLAWQPLPKPYEVQDE